MGLKCLASVLWFSHCLSIAFSVSREFPGNGYLKYDIVGKAANKQINSDKDELRVQFKTVQPTGLLFHTQTSGGKLGDYLTLELCGGRICVGMKLGGRNGDNDKKEEILGRDLSNGQVHKVLVKHNNFITTIVLNKGTSEEERREIKTLYEKLEVDIAIYVGGAPSFQNLQGVKSNTPFMGCLTDVEFTPEGMTEPIKFLVKGVADPVNVDMNKECPSASSFEPYTFVGEDSSFTFQVKKNAVMTGSFKFRSYNKKFGTLLKQVNGGNGFTVSYKERSIGLNVKIGNTDTDVSVPFSASEQKVNSGNWHNIEYSIGASSFSLTVDNKTPSSRAPSVAFPAEFFGTQAIAGGFTGCMRDLKINNQEKKPLKGVSDIKNVETDSCNITDLCIFSPCLNKGSCSQDGRSFTCDCTASGYQAPMCQFPESSQNCEELKKRLKGNAKDGNWTLDLDGPGPLKASSGIYCNMTADPPITVVYSEDKGVKVITDNNAGNIAQPYVADIRYYPSLRFAKALAMNSANCKQFIEFGCKNAKLLNAGEKDRLGNWVSAGGVYQDYWGGAPPNSESCACGVNNTCLPDKKKKCNCDARSNSWTKDEGFLTATSDLPVTQVVFRDVNPLKGSEANFTVGNLYCTGNISNTATFVNEDGMIKLDKWTPPSHGVISLFFRTPYPKGIILFNGFKTKEFFKLYIINETSVGLEYNIGNGYKRVVLSLKGNKQVNDRQWHKVVIYRNMKQFGLQLDKEEGVNLNPLFLEKDLDVEDDLYVGADPSDVTKGFVGCIRGLTINGEVIDLKKKAGSEDYVQGGCGAACKDNHCKLNSKCLDNYNVYECDCSLTPFYGYFCSKDYGASFQHKDSELTYTFPNPEDFPGVDIVVGFKVKDKDSCGGDIVEITSKTTQDNFLLRLDPVSKNLIFSFKSQGGDGSRPIKPPSGDFCDEGRHTFALSRRGEKINYTVDGQIMPSFIEKRLDNPFPRMFKINIGKKGDNGFKGCLTGVKATPVAFGKAHPTVEPIKYYIYDGIRKDLEGSELSREKCGPEPEVPKDIPTPRPIGIPGGSDNTATRADPTSGERADADDKTAIIIVVVLILVLLLVVLLVAIYWYWARHKGEYHTHEDDDVLKSTDPYIDMTAPRKPVAEDTEKKKEWYI